MNPFLYGFLEYWYEARGRAAEHRAHKQRHGRIFHRKARTK